jgi:hypothetical protein
MATTTPPLIEREKMLVEYQVANQRWVHSEGVRWSILYNFLVAHSVMVLAWAALRAISDDKGVLHLTPLLYIIPGVGIVLSIVQFGIGLRANAYIGAYARDGVRIEKLLGLRTPVKIRRLRRMLSKSSLEWCRTESVTAVVPWLIMFVHAALLVSAAR